MQKDIWQNLYEFPMIETEALIEEGNFLKEQKQWQEWASDVKIKIERVSEPMKQDLTHQRIIARFWEVTISGDAFNALERKWLAINRENLPEYAFPKVIDTYLCQKFLTLGLF